MTSRLRQALADSHVAAVTVAVFLVWALDSACRGLWDPVYRLGAFVFTGIAILDIPYISANPTTADRLMLIVTGYYFYSAIVCLLGAGFVSRWVYGMGPFRCLMLCGRRLTGREDA
jgi:hypothetical protein